MKTPLELAELICTAMEKKNEKSAITERICDAR